MRSVVRWAIENTPAMNTLMISVLLVGAVSLMSLRREVFPEFDLEIVTVTVPYPGGSPEEVEEGICRKIEEAVRSVDGIKKQTAVARENSGTVVLELEEGASVQKILGEVRSEVDRIAAFPVLAEDPEVKQLTVRRPAIQVGLVGPETERRGGGEVQRRNLAEAVRDDLIRLPAVSQAEIVGAKDYQIDIEMSETTLRRYGLTLQEVARIVRRQNFDLPGGLMRTEGQDVLIRGKSKRLVGREIAKIPLVTRAEGVVLTVGDLGTVRDEFADVTSFTRINGKPGMAISVNRTATEDLLAMADAVNAYVARKELPAGFELVTWQDDSINVRDRMELLGKNGLLGLVLVLLTLSVFLELRLAWWVALGIPISLLGACAVLFFSGQTLNMLSMFAFLMALGIVVDDAIVIGENIYTHRQRGVGFVRAAVDGTLEVLPSVAASVTTTIFAFLPLFFVTGVMGKFIAVMPLAMIAMLGLSLLEGIFILPCHLAHGDGERVEGLIARTRRLRRNMPPLLRWSGGSLALGAAFLLAHLFYPLRKAAGLLGWVNVHALGMLNSMTRRIYLPLLRTSLRNPAIAVSSAATLLLLAVALVRGGVVPFVLFPKLDSNTIDATVTYPDGTPAKITDRATRRLEAAIRRINARYEEQGTPVVRLTRRSVGYTNQRQGGGMTSELAGNHYGGVTAELVDVADRPVDSQTLLRQWRGEVGELPGVESLIFGAASAGPGGTPLEFKLLAKEDNAELLEQAVAQAKAKLREYPGVFDVRDDSQPGKWELQLRVKQNAEAMGVSEAEVAETIRAAYHGEEVMRLQRGRHEVKLMVRYPRKDRRSLAAFEDIRIRGDDDAERPLTELADVRVERSLSEINRVDQLRAVTVSADVDEKRANAREIVSELQAGFIPELLKEYPALRVRWEGQQEQTQESLRSLFVGFLIALAAMFVLLTLEFRSYFQPLLILAIIPFGIVGAIGGHALMGLPLTMFSMFGLVALTGVVVNDSIVLIDFINHRVRDGIPLEDALLGAGQRRLRPILLTSVTTVAGLLPLLLETSFQAQLLIPMAVSLCFGLMVTSVLILLLVPTFYLAYARMTTAAEPPLRLERQRVVEEQDEPVGVGV